MNAPSESGQNALQTALDSRNAEAAKVLLSKGVELDTINHLGYTTLRFQQWVAF